MHRICSMSRQQLKSHWKKPKTELKVSSNTDVVMKNTNKGTHMVMVSAGIIERKLRRTKVRLFTVPCCSIILFSSKGMKKNVSDLPSNFFRRSIILVGALLFYNSVFHHFSHISHFRSIINVSRAPFYN